MADGGCTPEDLRALELYHQLANLSPTDADKAIMLTLRLPSGRHVGDVWLSATAVESLTDGALSLNALRDYSEEAATPGDDDLDEHFVGVMRVLDGLPDPLPDPTEESLTTLLTEAEAYANRGGQR